MKILKFLVPLVCLAALLGVLGVLYRGSPPVEAPAPEPVTASPAVDYEQLKPQYMEMVTKGIKKLEGFSGAKYRGNAEAVKAELLVFQAWALLLNEMERYPLTESEKDTVRSLGRRVVSIQRREFPAMRAEWAKSVRNAFSRYKVLAWVSGDQGKLLRVIVPPEAGMEAVNRCMIMLDDEATAQLRFRQVNFTFTDERTVTANFSPLKKVAPPPDSELVYWQEKRYETVSWTE